MSAIRSSGTKPEQALRQALRKMTNLPMKYNAKGLPGTPDIVVPDLKLAVFVDGCFWHGCPEHGKMPKSRKGYWIPKIVGNMIRDEENVVSLEERGWIVWRVWEHDLQSETMANTCRKLSKRLARLSPLDGENLTWTSPELPKESPPCIGIRKTGRHPKRMITFRKPSRKSMTR
jgi:DNA mismatch endonuclease, patch repair protein